MTCKFTTQGSDLQEMCRFCEQARAEMAGEPSVIEADLQSSRSNSAYASAGRVSSSPYAVSSRSWSLTDALAVERCGAMSNSRVPVTILTGFLGAGKTTVLQHILTSSHGKRLAVIENEFGEVSVDEDLLSMPIEQATGDAQVVLMPNGCLCCRARQDLVEAFQKVLEQATASNRPPHDGPCLDGLILELSGLSEVGPVVQTFFSHPQVQKTLRLDAVVCVCDARALTHAMTAASEAEEGSMEVIGEQLSLSDRVLLNKLDLLEMECGDSSGQQVDDLRSFIRSVNPGAVVVECVRGEVPIDGLLRVNAFSLDRLVKEGGRGEEVFVAQLEAEVEAVVAAAEGCVQVNGGTQDVPCDGLRTSSPPPSIASTAPGGACPSSSSPATAMTASVGAAHATATSRAETDPHSGARTHEYGEAQPQQHVDNDHQPHQNHEDMRHHSPEGGATLDHGGHMTGSSTHAHAHTRGQRKPSQLHVHVSLGYVSVGVRLEDGPLQWSEFEGWLARVLKDHPAVIVRLKGVLWVTKRTTYRRSTIVQRRVIVQGVFGHVEDEDTGEWPTGTKPCTRLVLIGRLPPELQEELKRGVVKCLAPGYIATSEWAKRLVGRRVGN